jgi:hypothetical protein
MSEANIEPGMKVAVHRGPRDKIGVVVRVDGNYVVHPEKGLALAKRIRTGNVTVNGLNLQINAPFGGYKESGIGRVGGPEGLEGYQEIKSVYMPA